MAYNEPINLTQWKELTTVPQSGRLFTCGRPGRATYGRDRRPIDKDTIDIWVKGLPETEILHVVSLLGKKRNGLSEFWYYPFRSSKESGTKPTFQEWLDEHYARRFVVHEFPTVDAQGIRSEVLEAVTRHVLRLMEQGGTVLVIDSAGAERTARICEAIGYTKLQGK